MKKKGVMVLAGLVLFASGAVMGYVGSRLLGDRGPLALLHGDPRHFADMALRRMSSDLDLTQEQQEKLRPIVMDTARQIIAIRREQEPHIRDLIATSMELTKALLTPEQREKFTATMDRFDSRRKAMGRFGPPPPPGGDGFPPPPPHGFGPPPGMDGMPPPDLFDPEWDLPPPGPHPGPPPGQGPKAGAPQPPAGSGQQASPPPGTADKGAGAGEKPAQ
jgi:Spy/CpxP family protein refolding chaperone